MERDFFVNKSYCELVITSKEVEPHLISDKLSIVPTNSYVKGASFSSKHTGKVSKRFQNLWSLKSKTIISEKEDLTPHTVYFINLFKDKLEIFSELKKSSHFDISFWIWIETEDVGIGLNLQSEEILFINQISSRVHISIIANRKIT